MADFTVPEEWRPVEGFPYEISNLGRIRRSETTVSGRGRNRVSPKGRLLKQTANSCGYKGVTLYNGKKRINTKVHQLVCKSFHGPRPSPEHQVAHNNGDKTDNRASNLRWATREENSDDMIIHGTRNIGARNPKAILADDEIGVIRKLVSDGIKRADVAAAFGVSKSTVIRICLRRTWSHLP